MTKTSTIIKKEDYDSTTRSNDDDGNNGDQNCNHEIYNNTNNETGKNI